MGKKGVMSLNGVGMPKSPPVVSETVVEQLMNYPVDRLLKNLKTMKTIREDGPDIRATQEAIRRKRAA